MIRASSAPHEVSMPARKRPRVRDLAIYLAGIVLFTASLTVLWRSMRAVMDIGGYCASGGPYEIAVECPQGVDILLFLSIWVGLAGLALVALFGGRIGPGFAGVAALAWPALFLSLGWNFLEYGVSSPGGPELGWLIPGVLFLLMGGVPLWFGIRAMRGSIRRPGTTLPFGASLAPAPTSDDRARASTAGTLGDELHADLAQALRQVASVTAAAASTTTVGDATGADGSPGTVHPSAAHSGLVDQLERLSRLHEQGALGEQEYRDAQRAVIEAAAKGETA
jgi:hypothetical protein